MLSFLSRRRDGIIKARIEHEGQVFQDIIEVGEHLLECKVKPGTREVRVILTNPTDVGIEGEIDLITPLETWPIAEYPDCAVADITRWRHGFQLAPGESSTFTFGVDGLPKDKASPKPAYWAVARLMYNGRVHHAPVTL
jgi:hypothetical protein